MFLIDTYHINKGIKNFITVAKEMEKEGRRIRGLVIDSGDIHEIAVKARKALDEAGLNYAQVLAMSDLEEYKVEELVKKNTPIDVYGAATEVLNVTDAPKLEVVYKLSELNNGEERIPKMKLSTKKMSLPGRKQVFRVTENEKYQHDIIGLEDEDIPASQKMLTTFIKGGKLIQQLPTLNEINNYHHQHKQKFHSDLFKINEKVDYLVKISHKLENLVDETRTKILTTHA